LNAGQDCNVKTANRSLKSVAEIEYDSNEPNL